MWVKLLAVPLVELLTGSFQDFKQQFQDLSQALLQGDQAFLRVQGEIKRARSTVHGGNPRDLYMVSEAFAPLQQVRPSLCGVVPSS